MLIPTAGLTAAYAEQAHKVTLNASSNIFARGSKLQTSDHRCFLSSPSPATCEGSRLRCKCACPAACFHCWTDHAWAREMGSYSRDVSDARYNSTLETIILQSRSFQRRCPTTWECVDRTNLQATITNENREAAPRSLPCGVFCTRCASSLMQRLSAGIPAGRLLLYQPAGPYRDPSTLCQESGQEQPLRSHTGLGLAAFALAMRKADSEEAGTFVTESHGGGHWHT